VAGLTFLSTEPDSANASIFAPVRIGDAVVMFAGNSLEERVADLLQADGLPVAESEAHPIDVRMDVSRMMALMIDSLDAEARERSEYETGGVALSDEPEPRELFSRLRMLGLKELALTMAPRDEHVLMDVLITEDPQQPSILDLLRPADSGAPDLLPVVPRSHRSWSLAHLRSQELVDMALEVTDLFMPGFDMSALDAMFGEQFEGLSLSQDFLTHLGDEVLWLSDPEAGMDADLGEDPMGLVDGIAIGFELKDASAFAKSLDQMLRSRGLHASRKTSEYRGIETFEMPFLGMVPLEWAFGADFMILGIGPSGAEQAHLVLDAEIARRAGEEPPPFPEPVRERLDVMPSNWVGASVTEITPILDMMADLLGDEEIGALPEMADMFRVLSGLARRYGLNSVVSTNTFEDGRVLSRTVW
jgi:hypothetical protein